MEDCLFCKFVSGQLGTKKVYEDDDMIIINDIDPRAPIHYLLIPKNHYALLSEASSLDLEQLKRNLATLGNIADTIGLADGYRLIINQKENAGQSIKHLHIHILAGKKMDWTPA